MTRISYLAEADIKRAAMIMPNVRINKIVAEISEVTGIPEKDIMGDARKHRVCMARQMAYYVADRHGFSSRDIADAMHKDHTTVLYGIKREKARRGE